MPPFGRFAVISLNGFPMLPLRPLGVAIVCCMYILWLWVWWAIMFGLTIYKIHYTGSPIGLPVLDLALCGAFLLSEEISLQ